MHDRKAVSKDGEPQPWKTLASEVAFHNRWTTVAVDRVALPDGREYAYTRLEPAGIGVGVVGFNAAGEILLEREYRHGVGEVIWQLPGGLASEGEDLQAAGLRELEEETGFAPASVTADTVRYLGSVWDNPAMGRGQSHIFAAWGLAAGGQVRRDAEEIVALHWVSPAWLRSAVADGAIKDRVVVAAVAYLMLAGLL